MGKKKKRTEAEAVEPEIKADDIVNGDSHKKTKKKKHKNDTAALIPTVTVSIAGSIIPNAQSLELATRLAGQIARAVTIFRVDEVVVFDNNGESDLPEPNSDENESGAAFLIRILRYLETPQYLRKALFPKHNSLRCVGLLPPLDAPHHLRKHEWGPFWEGVTLKERSPDGVGTLVDVGLSKNVVVDQVLNPGTRVTVAMGASWNLDADISRQVVSSSKPREEAGTYWGYKVRYASNITSVMTDCPYEGGYDHLIGTSEHGQIINSSDLTIPTFRHLLIAFGGLAGLEQSIEEDHNLKAKNVREVFDIYLNTSTSRESHNSNRGSDFNFTSVFPRTNQQSTAEKLALELKICFSTI